MNSKKEKKDILFLCQFFYPEYISSATLPFDTASDLAAHGFTVSALCGYPREYNKDGNVPLEETAEGVDIRRIRYIQLKRARTLGRLVNYFSFTFLALLHCRELKNYRCVIVYSVPPILPLVAVRAKRKYGTRFLFVAYDIYPEVAYASGALRPGDAISKLMGGLNRRLYRDADHVVALTDEMRQYLLAHRKELTEDRISTVANWAHEGRRPADDQAYARFGYEGRPFVVSYFGNMGTCQEMETLVGAARLLKDEKDIRFLIVGHGVKKPMVEQALAGQENACVLDFLTGEEFEQAVSVSSAAVISLEKGLKGTCAPSKYYSYLRGGLPLLAVVEEGSYLAEEVEGERIGHAVTIGDVDGLARAIRMMADAPDECAAMGRRAGALYEARYAKEVGMKKYRDIVSALLRPKKTAP